MSAHPEDHIAIIGMAGRFPGADSIADYWRNLLDGVESVIELDAETLADNGVPLEASSHPAYVPAKGVLAGADEFDAAFFGIGPAEAVLMDPQQRLFLQTVWHGLESAGYAPNARRGSIGLFGACGSNWYQQMYLSATPLAESGSMALQLRLGNDRDFLTSRVSHRLDLTGPSVTVSTACSGSLVAVHLAVQSLLNGECEVAVAGGVSVTVPLAAGYRYEPGGIASRDGHCRAFDRQATGTVGGDGAAVVVLQRLDDAIDQRANVRAVIRGSATNNDGAEKVGFTAPSAAAQEAVIREAIAVAGVAPADVGYVETHGTGTSLGDAIEVSALRRVFEESRGCRLGAVKTNIGHLDVASGVAGLIKTVLILENEVIPPTLHFVEPHPDSDLASSPFEVVGERVEWARGDRPRLAGVSSFGMGGTNAHVVLEEAPRAAARSLSSRPQLLVASANSEAALARTRAALASAFDKHGGTVHDVAATLAQGRSSLAYRTFVVCDDMVDARVAIDSPEAAAAVTHSLDDPAVIFVFGGQGAEYAGMGAGLYDRFAAYRTILDETLDELESPHRDDLRRLLTSSDRRVDRLEQDLLQPAVVIYQYAVAQLLRSHGVHPTAVCGNSLGELAAAAAAGAAPISDIVGLAATRGELMAGLPRGAMTAIFASEAVTTELVGGTLDVAVVNDTSTVVAGMPAEVERLEEELSGAGIDFSRLDVDRAMHSRHTDPILPALSAAAAGLAFARPVVSFCSTATGMWTSPDELATPSYWAQQVRQPSRVGDAIHTLGELDPSVFVQIGPGRSMVSIARRVAGTPHVTPTAPSAEDSQPDDVVYLTALGRLWAAGVPVDTPGLMDAAARRIELPGYDFETKRYWPIGVDREPLQPDDDPVPAAPTALSSEGVGSEAEPALAGIWADVLGVGAVAAHADFFDLGGDSLTAVRICSRISDAFHVEIAVQVLFEAPVFHDFVAAVEQVVIDQVLNMSPDEVLAELENGDG